MRTTTNHPGGREDHKVETVVVVETTVAVALVGEAVVNQTNGPAMRTWIG